MSDKQTVNPELVELLARGLDAVLDGQAAPDEVAAANPQYADELALELEAALLVSHMGATDAPQMGVSKVNALERRLRAEMRARSAVVADEMRPPVQAVAANRPTRRVIGFPVWTLSRAAAVLVAVLLIFGAGGGGLVIASSDALPGDVLYPVKRGWESVQLTFGTLTGQADAVRRDQVEARLDEALALAEHGTLTLDVMRDLETALESYVAHADTVEFSVLLPLMERIRAALGGSLVIEDADDLREGILALTGPTVTPSPTATPTATVTPTATFTESVTETPAFSPTPAATSTLEAVMPPLDASPTPSRTPRIPPTPSRTPTATTTGTLPPTSTMPPTATITPVPMVVPVVTAAPATDVPDDGGSGGPIHVAPSPGPSPTWYPWTRATQDALAITKTAEAVENP